MLDTLSHFCSKTGQSELCFVYKMQKLGKRGCTRKEASTFEGNFIAEKGRK
jgi:hypothetical protein